MSIDRVMKWGCPALVFVSWSYQATRVWAVPLIIPVKEPDLLRTTPVGCKIHSGTDIEIQEKEEAQDIILSRQNVPFNGWPGLVCLNLTIRDATWELRERWGLI